MIFNYKCEYCGAEFDDQNTCALHEYNCPKRGKESPIILRYRIFGGYMSVGIPKDGKWRTLVYLDTPFLTDPPDPDDVHCCIITYPSRKDSSWQRLFDYVKNMLDTQAQALARQKCMLDKQLVQLESKQLALKNAMEAYADKTRNGDKDDG